MVDASLGISVILPVYKPLLSFRDLLNALSEQQVSVPYEVIIVDDCSPLEVYEEYSNYAASPRSHVFQVSRMKSNQGPALVRNFAVSKARGEVLVLIDADCVLSDPCHLEKLWQAHCKQPDALIGGGINGVGRGYVAFCDHFCHWATNIPFQQKGPISKGHLAAAHLLIQRTIWDKIGPFDPLRTGEDTIFCLRAQQRGVTLYLRGDIVLNHHDRQELRNFLNTFFEVGKDRKKTRQIAYGNAPWFLKAPPLVQFFFSFSDCDRINTGSSSELVASRQAHHLGPAWNIFGYAGYWIWCVCGPVFEKLANEFLG